MPRPVPIARSLAMLGMLASCTASGEMSSDAVVRRDSAGIEIVEVRVPQGLDARRWTVDSTPIFAPDSDDVRAEFQAVRQVLRLGDGTVIALDAQPPFVRAFAPDGSIRWTAVGEGDGPGEMRRPTLLSLLRGDSLAVDDRGPRSLLLANDGTVVGVLPTFGPQSRQGGAMRVPMLFVRLRDGRGIGVVSEYRFSDLEGTGVYTFAGSARVLTRSGESSDFAHWRTVDAPRMAGGFTMLLGAVAAVSPAPNGFVYGFPRRDELIVYDEDGRVRRLLRGNAVPRAPTDEEIARAREAYVEDERRGNAEELRRRALEMTVNDTLPLFGRVIVGHDGGIWRERFDPGRSFAGLLYSWSESAAEWDVFAPDGGWLALVTMPPRFVLTDAGADWIAGFQVDEFDVQSPRVHAIRRH